jgi:hypothetical protein
MTIQDDEWLPFKDAWRAWGPPDAVRELDVAGPQPLGWMIDGFESYADARARRANRVRDEWFASELRAGRLVLRAADGPGITANLVEVPAWKAAQIAISSSSLSPSGDWAVQIDGAGKLFDPAVRQSSGPANVVRPEVKADAATFQPIPPPKNRQEEQQACRALLERMLVEVKLHEGLRASELFEKCLEHAPWIKKTRWDQTILPELRKVDPSISKPGAPPVKLK